MRVRTPLDVGLTIRERRRALGLDQSALAELVGVSRQWIVGVEQGRRRAQFGLVLRTLDALGIALHVGDGQPGAVSDAVPQVGETEYGSAAAIDIDAVVAAHTLRREPQR